MTAASPGAGHLAPEVVEEARQLLELYPHRRSALIPICHLAQEQDGWLGPEAVEEIAALVGVTPAEVVGTASFYEMLHTEPVGTYVVSVCTNIACMLKGAYELLDHIQDRLGVRPGATTADGVFTLEDAECIADCGRAPSEAFARALKDKGDRARTLEVRECGHINVLMNAALPDTPVSRAIFGFIQANAGK